MAHHTHEADDDEVHVHVHSWKLYAGILAALLALTVLTVAVSLVDLDALFALGRPVHGVGAWNLGVALVIAGMKASLVVLFFMHLKEDSRFNALFFVGSLLFVGVFFAYTMNDTATRGLTGDRYNGVQIDPDTGERAPGGIAGPIEGESLEQGLATEPTGLAAYDGDYAAWGAALFTSSGCTACHAVEAGAATLVGPTLFGVAGTEQPLSDGTVVLADEAYLRSSMVEPSSQIVDGFTNAVMPSYASLSAEELRALVAYLTSIGASDAEGAIDDAAIEDQPVEDEALEDEPAENEAAEGESDEGDAQPNGEPGAVEAGAVEPGAGQPTPEPAAVPAPRPRRPAPAGAAPPEPSEPAE